MATPLRRALSLAVGWAMDRRIPTPLRARAYRAFARAVGADVAESRGPLEIYPTLGAFFVRRLVDGARVFPSDPNVLPAPCDGAVQAISRIERGALLHAKGRAYPVEELLAGRATAADLEGGQAWIVYLSPRDYHRVHCPLDARLVDVAWAAGARYSVAPAVLERRRVLDVNERAVLSLESRGMRWYLVMVGALNVGRIRVVGATTGRSGPLARPLEYARGDELARFEMGSTVALVFPPRSFRARDGLAQHQALRMGDPIGARG
jgi:phosphatidylserine decarboxylase